MPLSTSNVSMALQTAGVAGFGVSTISQPFLNRHRDPDHVANTFVMFN